MRKLGLPFRNSCAGQKVLSYIGPRLWNTLPLQIRLRRSVNNFKHDIHRQNTKGKWRHIYVSVYSKPDHPPRATLGGFTHIPGVEFSLPCLARILHGGVLNQNTIFDNFEKSAIFALSLKQMSSSSFHTFMYARSGQCDWIGIPTYLLII